MWNMLSSCRLVSLGSRISAAVANWQPDPSWPLAHQPVISSALRPWLTEMFCNAWTAHSGGTVHSGHRGGPLVLLWMVALCLNWNRRLLTISFVCVSTSWMTCQSSGSVITHFNVGVWASSTQQPSVSAEQKKKKPHWDSCWRLDASIPHDALSTSSDHFVLDVFQLGITTTRNQWLAGDHLNLSHGLCWEF